MNDTSADEAQIVAIVADMFEAIGWRPDRGPDLARFAAAVHDEAILVPSARPIAPTTIAAFADRMGRQHALGEIKSFEERPLRTSVQVFGNIAVAIGGYEMKINCGAPSRGANAFLLVRDDGAWRIVSMAWDSEREGMMLPANINLHD